VTDEERTIIICVRKRDVPVRVARGSVQAKCDGCGCKLIVAPTGQRIMREHGAVPVCDVCATQQIAASDEAEVRPLEPDQAAELARMVNEQDAEQRRN
jgi:hypothetical protein